MARFISAKTILPLIAAMFGMTTSWAQKSDSVTVIISVIDAFTGAVVEDGTVDVLASDSSVISVGEWSYNRDNGKITASYAYCRVPSAGHYILRISHPDYFVEYYNANIRSSRRSSDFVLLPGVVTMRKRPKDKQLAGVTIKATKIKMVMKGDTLVYDADAFSLSQGSMLDALIEQLPGVELKENGVITVNGRVVSSLYVNGRDFFKGDPKVALENLPAYMVNKVKVYEQQSDFEKLTGRKEEERPLVMDVNLKKQYSQGWIANAEAAYGTHDKYLGRFFAMRFTDCSRLALYGNMNNTNDTRRPGRRGDWTPSFLPDGIQTSKTGGAEYSFYNRKKTLEWTSSLTASHTDNSVITQSSSESFLPSNRAFGLGYDNGRTRAMSVVTSHNFKYDKPGVAHHKGSLEAGYDRHRLSSISLYGEFADNPYDFVKTGVLDSLFLPDMGTLRQVARYRRSSEAYRRGENWYVRMPYHLIWLPFMGTGVTDIVLFDANVNYDKHNSRAFDNYNLHYFGSDGLPADYRNRYRTRPSYHYSYKAAVSYHVQVGNFSPMLTYGYSQDYRSGRDDLYRLDRLDGWGSDSDHELGTLPSSLTDMQQALDIENSEHSELLKSNHRVELKLDYRSQSKNQTTVTTYLPFNFDRNNLVYDRSGQHYDRDRSKVLFTPSALVQQVFCRGNYMTVAKLNYAMSCREPDLVKTIELVNDANPLCIETGNASLRRSVTHDLTFELRTLLKLAPLYNFKLSYRRIHNAFGTERTYNPVTGAYRVRPVNVGGNWRTDGSLDFTRQLGKQKLFSLSSSTSYVFDHNVDMANVDGETTNGLSTIKNLYARQQFTLSYSRQGWNVGAKVRGSYNRLAGSRSDFSNINAWDYNYGVNARVPLPLKFWLSTDFTVFSRRGYGDRSLNTDDLIWNMRLERSVMHGNLTFALDGFYLLHELSKVSRVVNAQGRTESYTNVMPAYFMLHAICRLNKEPKKK